MKFPQLIFHYNSYLIVANAILQKLFYRDSMFPKIVLLQNTFLADILCWSGGITYSLFLEKIAQYLSWYCVAIVPVYFFAKREYSKFKLPNALWEWKKTLYSYKSKIKLTKNFVFFKLILPKKTWAIFLMKYFI